MEQIGWITYTHGGNPVVRCLKNGCNLTSSRVQFRFPIHQEQVPDTIVICFWCGEYISIKRGDFAEAFLVSRNDEDRNEIVKSVEKLLNEYRLSGL